MNLPQDSFVLVMPSGPRCWLEKWTPNTHKAFFLIHLRFSKGMTVFINDSPETKAFVFFWHATHVVQLCIRLVHCPFNVCVPGRFVISASRSARFFTSKVRNNLTKPLEVNTFKRDRVKSNFQQASMHNNIA